MTEDDAANYFSELLGGRHHVPPIRRQGAEYRISLYASQALATTDHNLLTRAVFLSHDKAIRLRIAHSSPCHVSLVISDRDPNSTNVMTGHPTLETAFARWRSMHPARPEPAPADSKVTHERT